MIECECDPDEVDHESLETILDADAVSANVLRRLRRYAQGPLMKLIRKLKHYDSDYYTEGQCPVTALAAMRIMLEEEELALQGLVQASALNIPQTPQRDTFATAAVEDQTELEGAVALPPKSPGHGPFGSCLICYDRAREVAFLPCGHVACCEICSESDLLLVCPTCRCEIEDVVRVFLP